MVLSWLSYTPDREAVLDYVDMVPVFHGDYDFYLRSGKRETPRWTSDMFLSLLEPLDTYVWLIICKWQLQGWKLGIGIVMVSIGPDVQSASACHHVWFMIEC